jgi:hypothetical protein
MDQSSNDYPSSPTKSIFVDASGTRWMLIKALGLIAAAYVTICFSSLVLRGYSDPSLPALDLAVNMTNVARPEALIPAPYGGPTTIAQSDAVGRNFFLAPSVE